VLIAVERNGPVRAIPVKNEKVDTLKPVIDQVVDKNVHLMSDSHRSYIHIGQQFLAHSHVNHSLREYSRGNVHCNTAESFSSLFERARMGVFHYFSEKHLSRYLNEFSFRWEHRVPEERITKSGKKKIQMKSIPIIDMLFLLIMRCSGTHLRRTRSWGLQDIAFA
jgi:transposase-like protein